MKNRCQVSFIGIAGWWMLLLPFDYSFFDGIFKSIQQPFTYLLGIVDQELIFETDTYGTYVLLTLSVLLGILSFPFINWICAKWKCQPLLLLKTILASILFFFLFKYGWDKITKSQFYLPEPNTLFTPFGKLSKDIAYWSLIGSSYAYTVALGIIEITAAILLLFKRTQFLASLLAIGIFVQVLLINYSFDISVKLLSGSLLFFSILYSSCFSGQWKGIFGCETGKTIHHQSRKHRILKYTFACLVILECTVPSLLNRNFNDDNYPRLAHHGAYRVIGNPEIKYLFIHRQHYLILQSHADEMTDYRIDTHLPDKYTTINGKISCNWKENEVIIHRQRYPLQKIPHRNLPLLQESFHAFSDEFH